MTNQTKTTRHHRNNSRPRTRPPIVVNTELLYHDDISEAGHDSVLLVTVDGDFEDDIAMPIRFTPQGGADGSDYSITYPSGFANGNITFTPSHKSAVFQINPVDDAIDDDGEYILIEMEVPRGAIAQGPTSYMVNIIDNDHPAPEDEDCKNRNSAPGPQNCRMDVGELFNGAIGYGGDVDVIYVDGVKPNHTLQVDVLGNGLPDPDVYGFATDDDSGNGNNASAIWNNSPTTPTMAEHQLGQPVQRLHLYWTGEPNRVRTLLTMDNSRELRVSAVGQTASTVRRIQTRDYRIRAGPVPQVCNGCKLIDLRRADGTLRK